MSERLTYPTDEALDRIADAYWRGQDGDGVVLHAVYTHNACNHTLCGEVEIEGERYAFVIDSGDRNGTVVLEWGEPEAVTLYTPEEKEKITFVPIAENIFQRNRQAFDAYARSRNEGWFVNMERAYNYDRLFSPGLVTERHYTALAAERGLRPGYLSNMSKDERDAVEAAARAAVEGA